MPARSTVNRSARSDVRREVPEVGDAIEALSPTTNGYDTLPGLALRLPVQVNGAGSPQAFPSAHPSGPWNCWTAT